ncbi:hypothetical protein EVAR_5002_1 [Eumeta japonica]|uniref:Uncharacterized protein n=1 Tax=Eumeta variegata TaxID=151549 RepID=A0A4C1UZ35_EUMVA|nr:hypothetical protein EVAR_5002_1 [Eumeta japonica]
MLEDGKQEGVARSTVDMHRVRVRNRASVGATVARRAYSPAPICACVSTRQGYSRRDRTRIIRLERTSCNGDFGYRRVSPHPDCLFTMRTLLSMVGGFLAVWRRGQ